MRFIRVPETGRLTFTELTEQVGCRGRQGVVGLGYEAIEGECISCDLIDHLLLCSSLRSNRALWKANGAGTLGDVTNNVSKAIACKSEKKSCELHAG